MPRWLEQWISDEDERPLDCPFLLHNIARRQTGETRIFGTTWPVRAVADTTRLHYMLPSKSNNFRHRRMIFRMPIGCREGGAPFSLGARSRIALRRCCSRSSIFCD
jgi:hypothetical protein